MYVHLKRVAMCNPAYRQCVYLCIRIRTCMCTHVLRACVSDAGRHVCVSMLHAFLYMGSAHECVYAYVYIRLRASACVRADVLVRVRVYVCIHVCMYAISQLTYRLCTVAYHRLM